MPADLPVVCSLSIWVARKLGIAFGSLHFSNFYASNHLHWFTVSINDFLLVGIYKKRKKEKTLWAIGSANFGHESQKSSIRLGIYPNTVKMMGSCLKQNILHKIYRGFVFPCEQVWGAKGGPYEFKPAPAPAVSSDYMFSPVNVVPAVSLGKKIEDSFIMRE